MVVKYSLYPKRHRIKKDTLEIYVRFEFSIKGIWLTDRRISASLGIMCKETEWDGNYIKGKTGAVLGNNNRIDEVLKIIDNDLTALVVKGENDLANVIKEVEIGIKPKITGRRSRKKIYRGELSTLEQHELKTIKESYIENYDQHNERKMSANTKLKYDITVRYFAAFYKGRHKRDKILISEIDLKDMDGFKKYLLTMPKNKLKPEEGNLDADTARTYLSKMRALFKYAKKPTQEGGLGIIQHVPIRENLIGAFDESDRESLTVDEVATIWRLKDKELSKPLLRSKYLFLFLCGSGTGYEEAKSLKPEYFEEVDDNNVWLSKERTKNNKKYGVTLLPFAVDAYRWFKEQPEFFGCITSEANEQDYLRELAKIAGINNADKITLYVGRTTFTTNLLAEGVDKWQVKDMLGHANLSMLGKYDKYVAKIKAKAHQRLYEGLEYASMKK